MFNRGLLDGVVCDVVGAASEAGLFAACAIAECCAYSLKGTPWALIETEI